MEKFKKISKIVIYVFVFVFIAFIIARIILADFYPSSVKKMHFTDSLSDYYFNHTDDFYAESQKIRIYYDNNKEGNFFADHMITVRDAGSLQVCLRYNDNALENASKFYGKDVGDKGSEGIFEYTAFACDGQTFDDGKEFSGKTYTTSAVIYDSVLFYNYDKIVFDGIDFDGVTWVRIDIRLKGSDEVFGSIVVYENNSSWMNFSEYDISKSEKPVR